VEDGGGGSKKGKKVYELGAQKVGKIIRDTFQMHTPPRRGNGVYFEWDDEKMLSIGKKYAALPTPEQIEKARQELALLRVKVTKPEQTTFEVNK